MRETKYKVCTKCGEQKAVKEFIKEPRNKDGYSWCKSCIAAKTRKWRANNKEKVLVLGRALYYTNQERRQKAGRDLYRKRKVEVLTHYGKGYLSCVNCGFDDVRALSIDHIDGGGLKHRRSLGITGGANFYLWLKREGYPIGYQTLCMNCQYTKKSKQQEV